MVGSFSRKEIAALRREARRPKHRFLISIQRTRANPLERAAPDLFVAQVLDMETRLVVHETPPQPDEQDARIAAGLWIERAENFDADINAVRAPYHARTQPPAGECSPQRTQSAAEKG